MLVTCLALCDISKHKNPSKNCMDCKDSPILEREDKIKTDKTHFLDLSKQTEYPILELKILGYF